MRQREVFFEKLFKYAKGDGRVILLYGDLGGQFLDSWKTALPDRTINMMPAEQNMILVAAGLAYSGFKPFCFSIIPFLVYRPFEMIRIYMGHQRLPVKLVGVGIANTYGDAGVTHWTDLEENCGAYGTDQLMMEEIYVDVYHTGQEKAFINSLEPAYLRLTR